MGYHCGRELIARAIVMQDDRLLVNHTHNAKTETDYFALPGGHVDPGESCLVALQREFEEELEAELITHDLALVSESIYAGRHLHDAPRHELVLYFQATLETPLKEHKGRIRSPEHDKNFLWLPIAELGTANLLPHAIKQFLLALPRGGAQAPPESPLYVFEDTTRR